MVAKAGSVWLLHMAPPEYHSVEIPVFPETSLEIMIYRLWLTTLCWDMGSGLSTIEILWCLATENSVGRHFLFYCRLLFVC